MNKFSYLSIIMLLFASAPYLQARDFIGASQQNTNGNTNTPPPDQFRASCIESKAQTDLDINNVRARLLAGGDMWWDGNGTARYIVPNVDPASGEPEVSSLFAGAVWLGAYDDGGNLILAAQTYRSSGNDFWNGPLDPLTGTIEKTDCERWDRHFECLGSEIDALRTDFLSDDDSDGLPDFSVDTKPGAGLLGWPGRGNPYFASIYSFELPDQDLAPFADFNGDGIYDPYDGDHPVIEVAGCPNDYYNPVYADQMIWWVYNDNGNIHTQTNGQVMKMEVQVTAFGYRTTDAINNMTFYRYKLLNRNALTLKDTYFSLWSDPDLGCFNDDMIGCDTVTGMGYVYNADADDDATCGSGGAVGYGSAAIPALGVDYFRGPLDSAGNEIGLSSFQYHVNDNGPTGDPSSALGYYRLISGYWPDGTPITKGNDGYNAGSTDPPTPYVFYSFPDETDPVDSWSMCFNGNAGGNDFRFLHTSGPFVLKPGATNEMISGVVWVPELPDYPCPSMKELVSADVLAQNLFDDCFKITDGPDAPYMDIIELENELVLTLNYTTAQNNYKLQYEESPAKLRDFDDSTYRFQGYKVYQVNDPNTSVTQLDDPEAARLIFQCDLQDTVSKIINWSTFDDEDVIAFIPEIKVEGNNEGIQHTFRILEDKFATNDPKLVNHQPYYFCVVAYGFNEYAKYNPQDNSGQADSYLQGRRNFNIYTGIPRNNSPEYYGVEVNSEYGDGPEVTRIDGRGNGGGLFMRVKDRASMEADLLGGNLAEKVTYEQQAGPISVKVVDPLRVAPGTFRLYISDEAYTWTNNNGIYTPNPPTGATALGDSIYWVLTQPDDPTEFWSSYQTIDFRNEQILPELGISLSIEQAPTPGVNGITGLIGSEVEYTDSANAVQWYAAIEDGMPLLIQNAGGSGVATELSTDIFNVLKTGNAQSDQVFDPAEEYSDMEGGWYPTLLAGCEYFSAEYYFSPAGIDAKYCQDPGAGASWRHDNADKILSGQRNVNIVITPDKNNWSRCIVVETGSKFYSDALGLTMPSGTQQMHWRKEAPSRDKNGNIESGSKGMSWFPGYAYDVETGERLNIFFGENSFFNGDFYKEGEFPGSSTGNDMIYNPTSTTVAVPQSGFIFGAANQFLSSIYGGHHYIYVGGSAYDECAQIISRYGQPFFPALDDSLSAVMKNQEVIWSSMSYMAPGTSMLNEAGNAQVDGNIPPSEVTFKLRVKTPYDIFVATDDNKGYPLYEFSLDSLAPSKENQTTAESALDLINIVPNPYYAYSDYEVTETDNVIKIVNLPPKCDVKIYSLDGRFVRQYSLSQEYNSTTKSGIARLGIAETEQQILTSLNWDLQNQAGVPVGSGVYLVHVIAKDQNGVAYGERVLKSFVINRAFDPQKL